MTRRALVGLVAIVALSIGVVGLGAAPASAGAGERILSYDVELVVDSSGDLTVTERIEYDFGVNRRHGIIREIPIRYRWDDTNDRVFDVDRISVATSAGTPAGVDVTTEGGMLRLRIGDPDVTITGAHRYKIEYRVHGALNPFLSHDELYWNVTGNDWPTPIDRASALVETPGAITRITCFAGFTGSTLGCATSETDGRRAQFTDTNLGAFEGLTVVVAIPKGAVSPEPAPILEERWAFSRAFSTDGLQVAVAIAAFVLVAGSVLLLVWRTGRDRQYGLSALSARHRGDALGSSERTPLLRSEEVPVEFTPPDDLRPGQVGTLVDETAHPLDVTATIVDLAVRGFLRIEEVAEPGLFRKGDWRLVRLSGGTDGELLSYEAKLMYGLFEGRDGEVLLSDLRTKFALRMKKVQDALYEDAMERGWFVRRPDRVRAAWLVVGLLALGAAAALTMLLARYTTFGLTGVAVFAGALILLLSASRMPSRTPKGRSAYLGIVGFRRFIEESEIDRARFAEEHDLFTEYLPYAIVFGATKEWAQRFDDLSEQATDSWYVGNDAFAAAALADALGDFSVATAGTLTSTPGGSGGSGFSGGGSSGGGGGGGGGGSW